MRSTAPGSGSGTASPAGVQNYGRHQTLSPNHELPLLLPSRRQPAAESAGERPGAKNKTTTKKQATAKKEPSGRKAAAGKKASAKEESFTAEIRELDNKAVAAGLKAGAAVEVAKKGSGLQECWFEGEVEQLQQGFALVRYQQQGGGTGSSHSRCIQEWFPTSPEALQKMEDIGWTGQPLQGDYKVHTQPGFLARPRPPTGLGAIGMPLQEGTQVQVELFRGSWQAAQVAAFAASDATRLQVKPRGQQQQTEVQLMSVRTALEWSPEGWVRSDFHSADVEGTIDVSSPQAVKRGLAEAVTRRFLSYRSLVPAEARPEYKARGQHLIGVDAALLDMVIRQVASVHKAAAESVGVKAKAWVTDARTRVRQVWNRAEDRHMECLQWVAAAATAPAGAEAEADASGRKTRVPRVKALAANRPELYKVPESFSADVLQPVKLTDRDSAQASVPLSFLARWLQLRSEIPEDDREAYVKGQHLRGRDADLCERCRAELMFVHHERLKELQLDDKWMLKEAKILIRTRVIRTRDYFQEVDGGSGDGDTPSKAQSPPIHAGQKRKRKTILSQEALAEGGAISAVCDRSRRASDSGSSGGSEFRATTHSAPSSDTGGSVVASECGGGFSPGSDGADSSRPVPIAHKHRNKAVKGDHSKAALLLQQQGSMLWSQKRKKRKVPTTKPDAAGGGGGGESLAWDGSPALVLPAEMAAMCATWSPILEGSDCGQCVFLAVGTAGGVLWLWRMKLPGSYSLRLDEPDSPFELVGMHLVSSLSSVTAVTYAQLPPPTAPRLTLPPPLLAIACSDGSVRLFSHNLPPAAHQPPHAPGDESVPHHTASQEAGGMRPPRLDSAPTPASVQYNSVPTAAAVVEIGTAVTADLLCVTCCQLSWQVPKQSVSEGVWEAELVVGKTMGTVVQWHCLLHATAEGLQLSGKGVERRLHPHGSACVSAITAAAGTAVSAAVDGSLVRWDLTDVKQGAKLSDSGVGLSTSSEGNSDSSTGHGKGTYENLPPSQAMAGSSVTGVALSPGGFFAVVARTSSTAAQKRMTNAERIRAGCVEMVYLPVLEHPHSAHGQCDRASIAAKSPWWQAPGSRSRPEDFSTSAAALWECASALTGCLSHPPLREAPPEQEAPSPRSSLPGKGRALSIAPSPPGNGECPNSTATSGKGPLVQLHFVPPRSPDRNSPPDTTIATQTVPAGGFADLAPALEAAAADDERRRQQHRETAVQHFLAAQRGVRGIGADAQKGSDRDGSTEETAWRLRSSAALHSIVVGAQRSSGGGFLMGNCTAAALLRHLELTIQRCLARSTTASDAGTVQPVDIIRQRIQTWLASQKGGDWVTAAQAMRAGTVNSSHRSSASDGPHGCARVDPDRQGADEIGTAKRGADAPADAAVQQTAIADPLILGGRWRVPLCPASLEPLDSSGASWECGACMRGYNAAVTSPEFGCSGVPRCVMCGIRLRPHVLRGFLPDVGL